jgi:hypothetical protein
MSNTKPRTGTSFAIQGCDLTFLICSRVFCSASLYDKKCMGAGDASPVAAASFAFNSSLPEFSIVALGVVAVCL